jgi:hypothetical protein
LNVLSEKMPDESAIKEIQGENDTTESKIRLNENSHSKDAEDENTSKVTIL